MSVPPWYRPRKRFMAERLLTLDLSSATGIGPLSPGLSAKWDMTPYLCATDPSHRIRVEVDAEGRRLRVLRRNKPLVPDLHLKRDARRFGSPLRAHCPVCGKLTYRLYLAYGWFRCGKCLRVTYASGHGSERDRVSARQQRLEHRLACTEYLPRHRGRRRIGVEVARLDARWFATMPASLLRSIMQCVG